MTQREEFIKYIIALIICLLVIVGSVFFVNKTNKYNDIKSFVEPNREIYDIYIRYVDVKATPLTVDNSSPKYSTFTQRNYFDGNALVKAVSPTELSLIYTHIPSGEKCERILNFQKYYWDEVNGINYQSISITDAIKRICSSSKDKVDAIFNVKF